MPMASRMICPATTATTRMIVAYTVARSAVRRRSARVSDAVNPAKIATLPIGSIVVQIVAKSLLFLMSKGDMVNGERLTQEVEQERAKVTTLKRRRSPLVRFPSVWIDPYRRKRSKSRSENESYYYAGGTGAVVDSNPSNFCCQCADGHLEAQRRQIEVCPRRNQKYYGHLRPSQR